MKRTLAIVLAAAVGGGLAGALIGIALSDGGYSSSTVQSEPVTPVPIATSRGSTRSGLTPEEIYRRDAPGVVLITDTRTQEVAPSFFSGTGFDTPDLATLLVWGAVRAVVAVRRFATETTDGEELPRRPSSRPADHGGARPRVAASVGRSQRFHWCATGNYRGMAEANKTTDHDEIRQWVESRGGKPAAVAETGSDGDPGILRIDFDEPGGGDDDRLQEISWDEWFKAFDENRLAFLYQDEGDSRFNKLVSRESS